MNAAAGVPSAVVQLVALVRHVQAVDDLQAPNPLPPRIITTCHYGPGLMVAVLARSKAAWRETWEYVGLPGCTSTVAR